MAASGKTRARAAFLKCECCNNIAEIKRKKQKAREIGHIKHMYCWKCKDRTAHTEVGENIFFPDWIKEQEKMEELS